MRPNHPPPPDDTHRWMYFEGGPPVDCQYWWCSRCGVFCEQPVGANERDGPRFWELDLDQSPEPTDECPECTEAIYSPLEPDCYFFGLTTEPSESEVRVRLVKRRYPDSVWRAMIVWAFKSLVVSEPKDNRDAAKKALAVLEKNVDRLSKAREQLRYMIRKGLV